MKKFILKLLWKIEVLLEIYSDLDLSMEMGPRSLNDSRNNYKFLEGIVKNLKTKNEKVAFRNRAITGIIFQLKYLFPEKENEILITRDFETLKDISEKFSGMKINVKNDLKDEEKFLRLYFVLLGRG